VRNAISGVDPNLFRVGKIFSLTGRGIKLRPKGPKPKARRAKSGGRVLGKGQRVPSLQARESGGAL